MELWHIMVARISKFVILIILAEMIAGVFLRRITELMSPTSAQASITKDRVVPVDQPTHTLVTHTMIPAPILRIEFMAIH